MLSPRFCSVETVEAVMYGLLGSGPVAHAAIYHLQSGGARTRAHLALEACEVLGLDQGAALSCACSSELLHNASLIHDDVQECDTLRRGRPAVWQKFGMAAAISAGDLMISSAFAALTSHPDPATALGLMHDAIAQTAMGQAVDLEGSAATLGAYRRLAAAKTGPLLALPVRLALSAARQDGNDIAHEAGYALAIAYQVRDDLADRHADRKAGRVNICAILKASGLTPSRSLEAARREGSDALFKARYCATMLPSKAGTGFCNLADELEIAFREISHAA